MNLFEDANINHTFGLLRPLFRCEPIGARGPKPSPFRQYLACAGTPSDSFLKQINFLAAINSRLFSLCETLVRKLEESDAAVSRLENRWRDVSMADEGGHFGEESEKKRGAEKTHKRKKNWVLRQPSKKQKKMPRPPPKKRC